MSRAVPAMVLAAHPSAHGPVVRAGEWMPIRDAYRLWRSHPGYRKACRALRRIGWRIGNDAPPMPKSDWPAELAHIPPYLRFRHMCTGAPAVISAERPERGWNP